MLISHYYNTLKTRGEVKIENLESTKIWLTLSEDAGGWN